MIKKLSKSLKAAFLSMLAAAFMVASGAVFALSNETTVVNSGDDAEVETEVESETEIEVENKNKASIFQYVESSSNTGNNDANGNIGGSSISTGNAITNVQAGVVANSNTTLIDLGSGMNGSNMTDVVNTGNDADIETEVETETEVKVKNDNDAWVKQWVESTADTGNNDAENNIGGSTVGTGDAGVDTTLNVAVNDNTTLIGGLGDDNGSSGLANDTIITNTGDDAEVESEVESETKIRVRNYNDLGVWQKLFGDSNSGNNDVNNNIGASGVMSGSALLLGNLDVSGNSNTTGIGGDVSSPESETTTDVVNTGDNLDTENETEIEMKVKVKNDNELWGSQWFVVNSETGFNDAENNIGGGLMEVGDSGTGANVGFGGNSNMNLFGSLGALLNLLAL